MKSYIAIALLVMMGSICIAELAFADGSGSDQATWKKDVYDFLMGCQCFPCAANISNVTEVYPCLDVNNSTASCPSCCEKSEVSGKKLNASSL